MKRLNFRPRPMSANAAGDVEWLVLGIAASFLSLEWLPLPFVWILAGWSLYLFYATKTGTKTGARIVCLNVGLLLAGLAMIDAYYAIQKEAQPIVRHEGSFAQAGYRRLDDDLGYRPVSSNRVTSLKYVGDELVYDVVYTIDAHGLRISPPSGEGDGAECILFFGGSFTFGEGVNDDEAMPYVVGIKTQGRYRVYNFGYHGYGPHQMLAALQTGLVSEVVDCTPRYAIYQTINDHVRRVAGKVDWGRHAPRYVLQEGNVVRNGHFDDGRVGLRKTSHPLVRAVEKRLRKSPLYERIILRSFRLDRGDLALMVAIVNASREVIVNLYPQCEFHVLFWDRARTSLDVQVHEALEESGLRVHLMSDVLSVRTREDEYSIGEHEPHPNALAYERVADYVLRQITNGQEGKRPDV